jgi:hypothetical protein
VALCDERAWLARGNQFGDLEYECDDDGPYNGPMKAREKYVYLQSAIFLVGIYACALDENPDQLEPNEPRAAEVSSDPLQADFNGDGYADLAIGVPGDEFAGTWSGAVSVIYGTNSGLSPVGDEVWQRGSGGLPGTPAQFDEFGFALAAGDFNQDGYADLAIGAPFDGVNGDTAAGSVTVLYGSSEGLSSTNNQFWTRDSDGILGVTDPQDRFGYALTTGDFDGDGYDDLAVGAPGHSVSSEPAAGLVHVIYGSMDGLTSLGNQTWTQDSPGVGESAEQPDNFGQVLAAGDWRAPRGCRNSHRRRHRPRALRLRQWSLQR